MPTTTNKNTKMIFNNDVTYYAVSNQEILSRVNNNKFKKVNIKIGDKFKFIEKKLINSRQLLYWFRNIETKEVICMGLRLVEDLLSNQEAVI